ILGRPAGWGPRPVELGDQTVQGMEARDICAGHHARRRLPLDRGQCLVPGRISGGNALGPAKADGASARPGGIRHRRPATDPDEAAAPEAVRETLQKVITFFDNHRRWMQDDVYLAAGLPVGTGVVESACGSVVKHRMEGEGKRWSLEGAEAILALRSLKKSHDNDLRDYWRFRARQVRARLDGRKPKYKPMPRLRRVASLKSVTL